MKFSYINDYNVEVNKYFNDIKNFTPISKEDEIDLGKKITLDNDYYSNKIVCANLKFVVKIANQYRGLGIELSDLISEGNIGLLKAIDRYDPNKGYKFITYAVWWIRQSIKEYITNINKTSKNETDLIEFNINNEEINDIYNVIDVNQNSFNSLETTQNKLINSLLDSLSERERDIIIMYYGMDSNDDNKTLEEIAKKYGLTRMRINAIKDKALKKMRSKSLNLNNI